MEPLADYTGLKSIEKLEVSHQKQKEFDLGSLPGGLPYGRRSAEFKAEATAAAIYGSAQIAKKMKL